MRFFIKNSMKKIFKKEEKILKFKKEKLVKKIKNIF